MNYFYLIDLINYIKNEQIDFTIYDPHQIKNKVFVKNIFTDTRKLEQLQDDNKKDENLFVAIKGEKFDSHSKIKILSSKCKIIIVENLSFLNESELIEEFCLSHDIIIIKTNNTRLLMAYIYKYYFKSIDEQLYIHAITGTDGKTSMVTILHAVFSSLFQLSASIGTLGVIVNGSKLDFSQTTPTTPEINDIYYILNKLNEIGVKFIFIEATSIASVQKRLESIHFNNLSFTTMTSDHLDFHKNLENYYNAKISFIQQLEKSKKKNKTVIYNLDDKNSFLIENELNKYENINSLTYGYNEKADFRIIKEEYEDMFLNIDIEISEKILLKYKIPENKKILKIKTNLVGKVNSYNICHSITQLFNYIVIQQKMETDKFFNYFEKAKKAFLNLTIPGRMERIKFINHDIYIDYAHTADALKNAIMTLKEAGYKKIFTIMGCGGNRDKSKRPEMGKISTLLSDFVIITSDNPRDEEPESIVNDIIKGITNSNYQIILEREKAIDKGFELLKKEKQRSALLIAGKGSEDYQEIKGIKYHFSDKEIVEKIINKI